MSSDSPITRDRAFVAAAALALISYVVFLNPFPDYYEHQANDPFTYLSLAKTLLNGEGYPTRHWHPGFPVLLAAVLPFTGINFVALKLVMVLSGLGLTAASYWYFSRIVDTVTARWLALLVAVNPDVFSLSHRLMAEVPATAMTVAALAAAEMVRQQATEGRTSPNRWTAAACVGGVAALLTRGNALALAPAFATAAASAGVKGAARRQLVAAALAIGAAMAAWSGRNSQVAFVGIDNVSYFDEVQAIDIGEVWQSSGLVSEDQRIGLAGFLTRVFENVVWHQTYHIAGAILPGAGALATVPIKGVGFLLALAIAACAVIGMRPLWHLSPAGATYGLLSLALILVYPTGGASRMLVPTVPVIVLAAWLGFREFLPTPSRWTRVAVASGLALCVAQGLIWYRQPYSDAQFGEFLRLLDQARNVALPGEGIVSPYPQVVSALSDFKPLSLSAGTRALEDGTAGRVLVIWQDQVPSVLRHNATGYTLRTVEGGEHLALWSVERRRTTP